MLSQVKYSQIGLFLLLLLSCAVLPFSFNYVDSFVFFYAKNIDGHYPFFYPLFVRLSGQIFSEEAALWFVSAMSYLLLGVALLYAGWNFSETKRRYFYILFFLLNPCLLFINKGLYSEAPFMSFLIINLVASYHVVYKNRPIDYGVFFASLLMLCFIRYVGLLSASFLVFCMLLRLIRGASAKHGRQLLLVLVLIVAANRLAVLGEMGVAKWGHYHWTDTGGRTGTYRAVLSLQDLNAQDRQQVVSAWMARSSDPQEKMAKEIIATADESMCWVGIYSAIHNQLAQVGHREDSLNMYTDRLLNRAYRDYLLVYNPALYGDIASDALMYVGTFSGFVEMVDGNNELTRRDLPSLLTAFNAPYATWQPLVAEAMPFVYTLDSIQFFLWCLLLLAVLANARQKMEVFLPAFLAWGSILILMSVLTLFLQRYALFPYFMLQFLWLWGIFWYFDSTGKKRLSELFPFLQKIRKPNT